jgi:alkanesulfonate monooxygenase SsuD/methylene tetrahydromethanopterin reductase-like flavin-dependent oxidoreductase (luciferase family)
MVTPLTRRRPWNLARETVTLDHISQGRLILGVGLGDVSDKGFTAFGEVTDAKQRAAMLDEGLEILTGLWSGQPFSYQGKHYQVSEITFLPPPVQSPRIPIWVGGYWPRKGPLRRAARWDGIHPGKINADGLISALAPSDVQAIKTFIEQHRTSTLPFDIVVEGETPTNNDEQARKYLKTFREAGATWWLEHVNLKQGGVQALYERIQQGPPETD